MSFLHAGVLAGLAAVAIPVILHLLMRQKPKRMPFPALRLLQNTVRQSTKRLRLRHLLLLAVRMLAIAALVFAVARPTLPAADYSLSWPLWVALSSVIVFAIAGERLLRRRLAAQTDSVVERQSRVGRMRTWLSAGTVAALLLLVGWPYARSVSASMRQTRTAEELNLPIAAVFVFDVSPSMGYERDGQTRLDRARELIGSHVERFQGGSRATLLTNARRLDRRAAVLQRSLSTLGNQLDRLERTAATVPLNEAIADAVAVHESDRQRVAGGADGEARYVRRIYVLTDLQLSAWQFPDSRDVSSILEESPEIGLFVLDVGVAAPDNRSVAPIGSAGLQVVDGGQVTIRTRVGVTGAPAGDASAELAFVDPLTDERSSRGREPVAGPTDLLFQTRVEVADGGDGVRFQQGTVSLTAADPLPFDDVQPFTLAVTPLPRILVVAPESGSVARVVAALEGVDRTAAPYKVTLARPDELRSQRLREVDVVLLASVPRLADEAWRTLEAFVRGGGGLAITLGSTEIESFAYNRAAAGRVLPGELDVYIGRGRFEPDSMLIEGSGPLRQRLANFELDQLLETAEIRRFWRVRPNAASQTIARLADEDAPLLLERQIGDGRVVLLTTAIDYRPGIARWNNLPTLPGMSWVYIAFLDELMRYLSRVGRDEYDFVVGETVRIPLPGTLPETASLKLLTPDLLSKPIEPPADGEPLRLPDLETVGNYQVTASSRTVAAFSVASDPVESDLQRGDASDLATVLGEDRFQLARDLTELNEEIDLTEFGREGFGALLLLACGLFLAETWLGARFYGD